MSNEQETKTRKPKRTIAEQLADLRAKKSAEIVRLDDKASSADSAARQAKDAVRAARAEYKADFGVEWEYPAGPSVEADSP